MRLAIVAVLLLTAATPTYALDLSDTMIVWKRSANAVRLKLLSDPAVAGQVKSNQTEVLACMNQVNNADALVEKTVKEMIDSCTKGKN